MRPLRTSVYRHTKNLKTRCIDEVYFPEENLIPAKLSSTVTLLAELEKKSIRAPQAFRSRAAEQEHTARNTEQPKKA